MRQLINRAIIETADGYGARWARQLGVSNGYLHDVMTGRRVPGDVILAALGLKRVVTYERTP